MSHYLSICRATCFRGRHVLVRLWMLRLQRLSLQRAIVMLRRSTSVRLCNKPCRLTYDLPLLESSLRHTQHLLPSSSCDGVGWAGDGAPPSTWCVRWLPWATCRVASRIRSQPVWSVADAEAEVWHLTKFSRGRSPDGRCTSSRRLVWVRGREARVYTFRRLQNYAA